MVYLVARPMRGDDAARTLTFAALVVSFVAIILTNRSWTYSIIGSLGQPNTALWWVLGGTGTFLALALYWPPVQRLFHFSPVVAVDLLLACAAGFTSILWFEGLKMVRRGRPPMASPGPPSN